MTFDRHLFSATIQSRLLERHLSLRDAARETGVSAATISRVANGDAPDMDTFAKLALWLQADINQFFHTPYREEMRRDQWSTLYLILLDLELSIELVEAVMTILRLIKKGGTA